MPDNTIAPEFEITGSVGRWSKGAKNAKDDCPVNLVQPLGARSANLIRQ